MTLPVYLPVSVPVQVTGTYSDGHSEDLTKGATGTTYRIGDPTIADAILDRIMQKHHRFNLAGDSLRPNSKPTD